MAFDLKDAGAVVETSAGDDGILMGAPAITSPRPVAYAWAALWAYIQSKSGSALGYDVGTAEGDIPLLGPSGKLPHEQMNLASVPLTGTPTAPTASPGTNTQQLANTAFVQAAITALINAAPGALDTLDELAAALGDDANFATTITNALALKAPLASPALTGTPTAPTAAFGTNSQQIATMAAVEALLGASEATVASATTCDIGAAASTRVLITGTTTITSLGTVADKLRIVRFGGGLTLTHNATTLNLPGGQNVTTQADDVAIFVSDASGNWRVLNFYRYWGIPLHASGGSAFVGGASFYPVAIASAATTNLGSNNFVVRPVTGTTTITSFGSTANLFRILVFSASLTLTHNATTLILPGGANIVTQAGDVAAFVSDVSGNWRCVWYQRADGTPLSNSGVSVPRGHLNGLTLSNNVTDATNDIDIAAGEAATDAGASLNMTLASALTKRLDAAWAVGTGQGGLDTGSIADTTYHVWLIQRSDTGVVDALFSTSVSSPTMPTNYDRKRRIGSIIRESGAIVAFTQRGDRFQRTVPKISANTSIGVTTAQSFACDVPSGIEVLALLTAWALTTGTTSSIGITPLTETDQAIAAATGNINLRDPSAGSGMSASLDVMTNTSRQVRVRAGASITTFILTTRGWIDTRGRTA